MSHLALSAGEANSSSTWRASDSFARSFIRRSLELMTSDGFLSWALLAWMTVLGSIVAAAPQGSEFGLSAPGAIAGAVSIWAMFAVLVLVWVTVLRHLTGVARISVTLLVFLLAGAFRGWALTQVMVMLDRQGDLTVDLAYRVGSNSTRLLVFLAVATLMIAISREQRKRLAVLEMREVQVESTIEQLAVLTTAERTRLVHDIKSELTKALADDDPEAGHGKQTEVASKIKYVSTHVVQPLSQKLADRSPTFHIPRLEQESRTMSWWRFILQFPAGSNIHPGPILLAALVAWIGTVTVTFGLAAIVAGYLVVFSIWFCLLFVVRWILIAIEGFLPPLARLILLVVLLVVSVVPAALAAVTAATAVEGTDSRADIAVAATFQGAELALLVTLAFAVAAQSRNSERQVAQAQKQLDWLETRAQLLAQYQNQQLAHVLHGPVLAEFNSALVQIQHDELQGTDLEGSVGEVSELPALDSNRHLSRLTQLVQEQLLEVFSDSDDSDLAVQVSKAATLWKGQCQIDLRTSDAARTALATDPVANWACNSLVQEAISDAVRDGAATVDIKINMIEAGQLQVQVLGDDRAIAAEVFPTEPA